MPDTFTYEDAVAPADAGFSFEEATAPKQPEGFSFEEATTPQLDLPPGIVEGKPGEKSIYEAPTWMDEPVLNIGDSLFPKSTALNPRLGRVAPIGKVEGTVEAPQSPVMEGVSETLRPALNSLTTPRNLGYMLASLGVASTGTAGKILVSSLWTGLMGKNAVENAPQIYSQLGEEMAKPEAERDPKKIASLLTQGGIDAAMAVAPAIHAAGELDLGDRPGQGTELQQQAAPALPQQPEVPNASSQQETATVHGDLRPFTFESAKQVPTAEGSGGIQSQTEGGLPEQLQPDTAQKEVVLTAQQQVLKQLGLSDKDISDLESGKVSVLDVVARKLQPFEGGGGPDHAKALEEARQQAVIDIERALDETKQPSPETSPSPVQSPPPDATATGEITPAPGEVSGEVAPDASPTEVANQPKGIAASVRNKWTSATESPLGSEAGFINLDPIKELWDKYSPSVKSAIDNIKGIAKEQMNLAKTSDYRRSVLNWSAKLQRSFGESAAAQKEIQDKITDPIRRDAVTNWIQAGGDKTVLQDRLAKTIAWRNSAGKPHPQAKKLIAGYEAALSLTPEEIAVAGDAKNAYDALGTRGQAHDVLNSFKDNYVTQIWDLNRGPTGGGARTLRDKFRFSKASTFPTFFDGEEAGFVPKTKDISKLLPVYLHEMNSVIAARQLVSEMSKGKASDGRPLIAAQGRGVALDNESGKATLVVPDALHPDYRDYKTLSNQPALHDWRWQTKDASGNPVFMKADLAIHPEAFDKFKNVLGKSAIKEWYDSKGSMSAAIPKTLVKGLDLFQSETKRTMLGLLTPFHQVQEGTHAIGHRVNPFFNNPEIDLVNNKAQMDAAQHGLMLLPDRASAEQFMEGFKQSKIVSSIPGLGPLADHYSNYLFHEYIPGIKFKTYEAILDRNLKVYEKDLASGKVNPEDVKILSASQANAAYGHLNYADLARNPTMLHLMRLGMLAPDFLEARMRFSGQAIKGLAGAKIGREQVIALATLAVAQAGLSYLSAKLTGGQWDAKDPFSFHLGNRKFTMRSVPEDSLRLAADTRAFVYARLNPVMGKGAVQLLSGTDWRGRKVSTGQTLKEVAEQPIPLALRPLFGTANSPLSGWEQLAGAAGLKISRYSAQSEVRKMAHDWMAKSTDLKTQAAGARYQKENPPDSDYKPLREALINNDFKTAQQEYNKLLLTKKPEAISKVFNSPRPFSGSAAREARFKQSLSPDDRLLYDQAKKEQLELRNRLVKMRQGMAKTD